MEEKITAFVARDEDGDLYLYNTDYRDCINKEDTFWDAFEYRSIPNDFFPDVKWEDEEPTEVEIILKQKKL